MYEHLHIQSIVPLLLEPLDQPLIPALLQLALHVPLDLLHEHPSLPDFLQRLLVLLHLAENGGLVEVGRDDVVLLLVLEVLDEGFFQVNSVTNCLQRHHEVLVLLEDAGEVVEGKDLEFGESGGVGEVLVDLRVHDDVDCFGDELDVAALLHVLDVLHRQLVHLLDEPAYLLREAELHLHPFHLQQHQCQMNQLLLAENALDRVALVPLSELADHCPDVMQDLLVTDVVVFDQFHLARCFHRNHL
jgi:hypothetical protein